MQKLLLLINTENKHRRQSLLIQGQLDVLFVILHENWPWQSTGKTAETFMLGSKHFILQGWSQENKSIRLSSMGNPSFRAQKNQPAAGPP